MHIRHLGPSVSLVQLSDIGHITETLSYPHEGHMTITCSVHRHLRRPMPECYYVDDTESLCSPACILYLSLKRALGLSTALYILRRTPQIPTSAVSVYGGFPSACVLLQLQVHGRHHIPVGILALQARVLHPMKLHRV